MLNPNFWCWTPHRAHTACLDSLSPSLRLVPATRYASLVRSTHFYQGFWWFLCILSREHLLRCPVWRHDFARTGISLGLLLPVWSGQISADELYMNIIWLWFMDYIDRKRQFWKRWNYFTMVVVPHFNRYVWDFQHVNIPIKPWYWIGPS